MAITAGLVIGGVGVIGGLVTSWMGSEAAKKVDERTRKSMAEALAALERNIKMPDLDPTPITLEQYNLVRRFNPELAQYVQEKMPTTIQEGESTYVKQAQQDALKDMIALSKTGGDATYRAEKAQGEFEAQQARKSQLADTLRNYTKQGMGGGGQELLANVASNQQTENSQRLSGLKAAASEQDRRMQALQGVASQSGQIRNQNYQVEAANTDLINRFNERAARTVNEQNEFKVKTLNDAQKYNNEREQSINNANVDVRNKNKVIGQDRADMIERTNREAYNGLEYAKASMKTGQANFDRQAGQDNIARNTAMANQFITGTGQLATAYADSDNKRLDKENKQLDLELKRKKLGGP